MTIKIEGTTFTFDLYDVIDRLTPEQAKYVADALSMHDDIRRNVIDAILNHETEMHSHPGLGTVDAERKRILESLDQIKDDRIDHLERELERVKRENKRLMALESELWKLHHRADALETNSAVTKMVVAGIRAILTSTED